MEIFNGIFQVTAVKLGIDLFIYIVSALVLLISEIQVQKYQLNNEEPASTPGSSNVEVQSIGKLPPTPEGDRLLTLLVLLKYLKSIC